MGLSTFRDGNIFSTIEDRSTTRTNPLANYYMKKERPDCNLDRNDKFSDVRRDESKLPVFKKSQLRIQNNVISVTIVPKQT